MSDIFFSTLHFLNYVWFIDINLYVDRIISYVNKKRSTRWDEKAQETQTCIESKEQLQDILKSMENLLNHGPGSSLSCLFPIFFTGATINRRFNVEKYGYITVKKYLLELIVKNRIKQNSKF